MCARQQGDRGKICVRACRTEDCSRIREILEDSREAGHWSASSMVETLQEHPRHFLLAWQDEEIAGFISGRRVADEGEILNLAVKPESRRSGVGKTLVLALLDGFWREGAVQVFLEVRESNDAALAFYRGMGFRQIGRRAGYYRQPEEAALVLALRRSRTVGTSV